MIGLMHNITEEELECAINSAYRTTLSFHEWNWNIKEQICMAKTLMLLLYITGHHKEGKYIAEFLKQGKVCDEVLQEFWPVLLEDKG